MSQFFKLGWDKTSIKSLLILLNLILSGKNLVLSNLLKNSVQEGSFTKQTVQEDDSEDSDYMEDEMAEVGVDMKNFCSIIDWDVEWLGNKEELVEDQNLGEDDPLEVEVDAFYSTDESDEPYRKQKLRKLRKEHANDGGNVNFYVGECFGNKKEIKDRIAKHSIETRRDLSIVKNDSVRVRVVCRGKVPTCNEVGGSSNAESTQSKSTHSNINGPTCPWVLHISTSGEDKTWVVKTYNDVHKCLQCRKVRQCTSSFLSSQIEGTILPNPTIPIAALKEQLQSKLQLQLSRQKVFRAKGKALDKMQGTYHAQYSLLRDYIMELQKTNPRTTVKLEVESEPNMEHSSTRQFKRIYVCLGALKKGFKVCDRELLGLDGAFMKGPFPGQILTAVGVDPNHGTYPLAYPIVEAENTDSWSWFLEYLGDDLELDRNSNFTFISDRQKGIIPALARIFPSAEHRFCLRHLHENMKKTWKGKEYKDLLWKCATATTVNQFGRCMEDLKKLNKAAHDYLKDIPPQSWSRSHFTGRAHCDVVLNNMCEVFNRQLIDGSDKPIIMALEYIREYLMKMIVNVRKLIDRSEGFLTPTATGLMNEIKTQASQYTVLWSGGQKYQVTGPWMEQCVVDPTEKVCTCRKWELTGIPCKHAVACIWFMQANGEDVEIPEKWVHPSYNFNTWKSVYAFNIEPISGREHWPKSDCTLTLTAPKHFLLGGPKRKEERL